MSSEIAIKIANLSKCYHIYENPQQRLKQFVLPTIRSVLQLSQRNYYREFWALRDVSFEVSRGETVGLIGLNGSGKSTLLQMICGTLNPTAGEMHVHGRIGAILELGSGFNPEFTGRENVNMNASLLGFSPAEINALFDEIAAFADIGAFMDQPIKTYSSGMVMRLAFAVQACVQPDILIVDEALAVGDLRFQNKCIRKMEDLKNQGRTILFVTHSVGMIEAFCDRVIWLHGGGLFKEGDPSVLVRQYVNFMTHGIEDKHKPVITQARLPVQSADEAGWIMISEKHNARNRGGVTIESVRVVSAERGIPVYQISDLLAHDLTVEAIFYTSHEVGTPLFGLGLHNELNEPVVHFTNCAVEQRFPALVAGGRYRLTYDFTLPPLRDGQYLVSVGMDDGVPGASSLLCHVYDAWILSIERGHLLYKQAGYVQLDAPSIKCELVEDDAADAHRDQK